MPTCFLHIGAHKTGTTAFQWFAEENRGVLAEHNVLYPEIGANETGSHLPLLRYLFGRPESLSAMARRNEIAQTLVQEKSPRPEAPPSEKHRRLFEEELQRHAGMDLLISAEDLENRVVLSKFNEIVNQFRSYGYEVCALMYVRNQPQYINSRYIQKTKVLNLNSEFEDFASQDVSNPRLRYSVFADEMDRLGVPFSVRPYNAALRKRGIAWDLLQQVIGAPVDEARFAPPRRANVSLGPVAVAAIRTVMDRLNESGAKLDHRQKVACKRLFHDEAKGPRWKEERSFYGLDTALASRIESTFAEDNDAFARRMFGRSWRDTFPEDVGIVHERNVFDPRHARDGDRALYREILDRVWPEVIEIARSPRDGDRRAERRRRRWSQVAA